MSFHPIAVLLSNFRACRITVQVVRQNRKLGFVELPCVSTVELQCMSNYSVFTPLAEELQFFPRLGLGRQNHSSAWPRLKSMCPWLGLGQIRRIYQGFNRGFII